MRDDSQNQPEDIRAGDFRKAWPTALAVAMGQASELVGQLDQTNRSIVETKDLVIGLAKKMPAAIEQAEGRLNIAVTEVTSRIAAVERHLVEATQATAEKMNRVAADAQSSALELNRQLMIEQRAFLVELKEERLALVRMRTETETALAQLSKAQQNFDNERKSSSSKSLLQRLFS